MHFLKCFIVSSKFLDKNRTILRPTVRFPRLVIVEIPPVPTSPEIAVAAHDLERLVVPVPRVRRHDDAMVMTALMTGMTHAISSYSNKMEKYQNSFVRPFYTVPDNMFSKISVPTGSISRQMGRFSRISRDFCDRNVSSACESDRILSMRSNRFNSIASLPPR